MSEEKIKLVSAKEDDLKKILEENLKISQEIKENTQYIKKFVIVSQVFSFLKLLIIIIPIVLGIIYLPPLLKDAVSQYQQLFDMGGDVQNLIKGIKQ